MPTVRCFQMRFSVSSVSYSSTRPGNLRQKSSMKSSIVPWRFSFMREIALALWMRDALYCGIVSGRSR